MKHFKDNAPLALLFVMQFFCMVFFLVDGFPEDIARAGSTSIEAVKDDTGTSDILESFVSIVLAASVLFSGYQLIQLLNRNQRMEDQLKIASGAFAELLNDYFDRWTLTPSERDIALLAIKGLSITEMAQIRDTKEGTIKAQCNAVYRKADVSGRPQLLSLFIEDLIADDLLEPKFIGTE